MNATGNVINTNHLYPNGLHYSALGTHEIEQVNALSREFDATYTGERAKAGVVVGFFDAPDPDADAWMAIHGVELLAVDRRGAPLNMGERLLIRETIADAMRARRTHKQIGSTITGRFGYSDAAASIIARTEIRLARGYGHHCGAMRFGMKVKRWLLSNDDGVCDQCAANNAQGWIGISETFFSGALVAIDHVGCRCDVAHSRSGQQW